MMPKLRVNIGCESAHCIVSKILSVDLWNTGIERIYDQYCLKSHKEGSYCQDETNLPYDHRSMRPYLLLLIWDLDLSN